MVIASLYAEIKSITRSIVFSSQDNPQLLEIASRNQVALTQSLSELDIYSETASESTANFFVVCNQRVLAL